jgi:hypothetical protein
MRIKLKLCRSDRRLIKAINNKVDDIMTNTDTALADLVAIRALTETQNATIAKIGADTTSLLQQIADLQANAPADTPQSVLDAIAEIKIGAQIVLDNMSAVDAQVPDLPQP